MSALDSQRLVEEELQLEGDPNRNLATFVTTWMEPEARAADRREQLPQLHRPRRVSDLGRDRAALHPHARRPLQRPRRDDRRPLPGLLRGDHARRPLAEVEVEGTPRSGGQIDRQAEPRLRRRRPRGLGKVLPLLRRRTAGGAAAGGQVHDRPRRRRPRQSTRTRSASPPSSAPPSPATPTTSAGINDYLVKLKKDEGPRRADPRRRRQRRLRLALPLPALGVGLPARAGALDQRLRPQVRARLPGHRLARLPREIRPRRAPRLLRELPRGGRRDLHPQLLHRRLDGAGAVLQLRPPRPRGLRRRDESDAVERRGAGREARPLRPLRTDRRERGAAAAGRLQADRRQGATTSSTSPGSSRPSAAGCCPPTRCRRTPRR